MPALKPLLMILGVIAFIVFLVIANLGGVSQLTSAGVDYITSEVDGDKNLRATLDPKAVSNIGAIGNFIFATLLTVATFALRGIHTAAAYVDEKLTNWNTPKLAAQAPVFDNNGQIVALTEITDAAWDKSQAVLLDAIFEKDKRLTIALCERMAGMPYLTSPAHRDTNAIPPAATTVA